MKINKDKQNIGMTCYLNILQPLRGSGPWDVPQFIIIREERGFYHITDGSTSGETMRLFKIAKKFVNLLP